jgi:hypothetical protein
MSLIILHSYGLGSYRLYARAGTGNISQVCLLSLSLNGFSGDVFLNIDPGLFEVWESSNQLRAELSLNLPFISLKMAECEVDNSLLRVG